jgi:hypothetical protein
MDFKDEIAYEQGTLIVATGEERTNALVDGEGSKVLFGLGDHVIHRAAQRGIIQRIVWWKRVSTTGKDFSYYVLHVETISGDWISDSAEQFSINAGHVDMHIPF